MTTRFAAVLSAFLFGLTANAAAEPAPPAEAATIYQIRFSTCDGFEIRVVRNYAAALPTGCAAGTGVAVGTIGRPPTGNGKVLMLGQNLNDTNNYVGMFLISYPPTNGGTITLIATTNGKAAKNAGSLPYYIGKPKSTRGGKPLLSQLEQAE